MIVPTQMYYATCRSVHFNTQKEIKVCVFFYFLSFSFLFNISVPPNSAIEHMGAVGVGS